jgi:hypothetical protein
MKNQGNLELIHEAAKKLCEVVEVYGGERATVLWGFASEETNDCVTGITLSDELALNDLRAVLFQLNGRAYGLIEFDD